MEKVNYEIPNVNSHYDDLVIEYVADKLSDDSPTDSHDDVINTNSSLDNFLSEKDREDNNSQYERLNQNDDIFNAPLGKAEVPDKRSDKKTQSYKNHHKVISNANITQFNYARKYHLKIVQKYYLKLVKIINIYHGWVFYFPCWG